MPTLSEAIVQLERFENQNNITNRLRSAGDETIISLRKDLQAIVADQKNESVLSSNQVSLKKAAYDALLALAESYPINDRDYTSLETQDEITESKDEIDRIIVFTSTGHWFALKPLIDFYNTQRALRSDYIFVNPGTMSKFLPDDFEHIKQVAAEQGIEIQGQRQPVTRRAIDQIHPAIEAMRVNAILNFPVLGNFMGAAEPAPVERLEPAQPPRQRNRLEQIPNFLSIAATFLFFLSQISNRGNNSQANHAVMPLNITALRENFLENPQLAITSLIMLAFNVLMFANQIIYIVGDGKNMMHRLFGWGDQNANRMADRANANEENANRQDRPEN